MRKKRVEHHLKNLTPEQQRIVKVNEQTIQSYLASRNLRPETKQGIKSSLTLLSHAVLKPFQAMSGKDINKFLESYENIVSRNSHLVRVKTFYRYLYDDELPKSIRRLRVPNVALFRNYLTEAELLTFDEITRLRNACLHLRDKVIVMVLAGTGARVSGIIGLRIKDVVDMGGETRLRTREKSGEIYHFISKSSLPWLRRWLNWLQPCVEDDGRPLFAKLEDPTAPMKTNNIRRILKQAAKRARIEKSVYPNLLRHGRATNLVREVGFDDTRLIMHYKHGSRVLETTYAHLNDKDRVEAYRRSENYVKPEPSQAPQPPKEEQPTCPRCRFENLPGSSFCARCMLPFSEDVLVNSEVEALKEQVAQLERRLEEQQQAARKIFEEMGWLPTDE